MSSINYQRQQSDGQLPVFVFPASLNFYFDDQSSHKQVLTLYNPYEFTIQFKVLSNNPAKYNVVESEGIIKKKCCIDIVIRANDFHNGTQREDKFRIHLYEHGLSKLIGKKDVLAFLLPTNNEDKKVISSSIHRAKRPSMKEMDEAFRSRRDSVIIQRSLPSIPVIILSLCCVIALMLPTDTDVIVNSSIPLYLHLSMNQKLVAAYVLGLVTMAVLKT